MEDDFIDIAEILKSYPKGTKLYSPICGECELDCLCYGDDVITVVYKGRVKSNYTSSELYDELNRNYILCFDKYGRYKTTDRSETNGEVMLFPSKNCRDWNAENFELRKKESEFKPFDKVLVRDVISGVWMLAQYAFEDKGTEYKYNTVGGEYWQYCIPYEGNEHLLGTTENCK